MKLIKPYYEIRTPINGEEILIAIEQAARTCYKSEGKIEIQETPYTDGVHSIVVGYSRKAISARELIPKLMNRNHEAMLEFGGMINVLFVCDRGVSHELVRHRVASFAQESTRYCNYSKGEHITFIIPEWLNIPEGIYTNIASLLKACKEKENNDDGEIGRFGFNLLQCESSYNHLFKLGWTPQQARSILPNSLKTEINVSANIREWRHILRLRTAKTAHPQMREIMQPLLNEFKSKIPILFDDINV